MRGERVDEGGERRGRMDLKAKQLEQSNIRTYVYCTYKS